MKTLALYCLIVLIWGSTWIVITFQLGVVPPELSVAYRFTLASLMLFIWLLVSRRGCLVSFSLADHLSVAAQGLMLFGLNYWFVYLGSARLGSGMVAVLSSLLPIFTSINQYVFLRQPFRWRAVVASVIGIAGVLMIFYPELVAMAGPEGGGEGLGALFCVLAAWMASVGNIIAIRNGGRNIPILETSAWAMGYGALFMYIVVFGSGDTLTFDISFSYISSLFYLAFFGSVIAFIAYFTLGMRIGPERSSYVSVAIPVVALGFSTVFEDYHWTFNAVVGVGLILLGNILMLRRTGHAAPAAFRESSVS
ncbi:MAG: DMT family transporter [Gammaproteobacteria bacterium]|nr:DMT family transporter [Gammaproteobacteria bacterium]